MAEEKKQSKKKNAIKKQGSEEMKETKKEKKNVKQKIKKEKAENKPATNIKETSDKKNQEKSSKNENKPKKEDVKEKKEEKQTSNKPKKQEKPKKAKSKTEKKALAKKQKKAKRVQRNFEKKTEKGKETFLETVKKSLAYKMFIQFLREHFVIVLVSIVFVTFLISLKASVAVMDRMNPSSKPYEQPKITDQVTFDMEIEGGESGKLVFGLYGEACPLTVKNFIMLAKHTKGYGYKKSQIFSVIANLLMLGGDVVNNDGTGGRSALEESFEAENFKLRHVLPGTIGMMRMKDNDDSHLSSQFYITLGDCSMMDGQTVVFGHMVEGGPYLSMMEKVPIDDEMRPKKNITIVSTKHEIVT